MLQTIEVEIDRQGHIRPLEILPLPQTGKIRALLTILPGKQTTKKDSSSVIPEAVCGVVVASHSVSLEEMSSAVRGRGGRL